MMRRMQLKAGQSIWANDASPLLGQGPILQGNLSCDVAIIGAGITGAMAGEHLARAGVNVIALDQRQPCMGSTLASTGLIQYELDTSLLELIAKRGTAEAMDAYRCCYQALLDFPEYLTKVGAQDHLQPRQSLYLATEPREVKTFAEECDARKACGIDVQLLSRENLAENFGIDRPAGIHSPVSHAIDPLQVTRRLWEQAITHGLRLHTPVKITRYDADDSGVTLTLDTHQRIRAKHVVLATGYVTPIYLDLPITLLHTYAIASQPGVQGRGWNPDCLLWESARPYLYARSGPDGCAIIGGCDQPWSSDGLDPKHIRQQASQVYQRFSQSFPEIELIPRQAWAGVFAETPDGLPYIGPAPQFPRGYFTLGYGGNGILFSFIAARIILDLFEGKPCRHAPLFRLDR